MTPEELKRVEVEDKVPPQSRDEMLKFFESTKKEDPAIAGKTFESVEEGLRSLRRRQLVRDRWMAFANELYDHAHVRIDLAALGRPQLVMRPRGPHRGSAAPKFVLAEYADLKSPFCARADAAVKQVLQEYGGVLAVFFRQKPAPGDADSMRAAEAALCAADQNKYWEFREELFANQQDFGVAAMSNYAEHTHLDVAAFGKCLDSGSKRSLVQEDIQEAESNRLEGSPVFSLNGTRLSGAHEFADFKELIDTELTWSK
jgi:predicted DsbA family dithiol-disulfide isomerase